ncbi:hypothetical protein BGX38DRAFT_642710 [Terfezia claveryi]|nr:hypothetical protein BGX38DRAFT_642710 [Terfezia claveryi]
MLPLNGMNHLSSTSAPTQRSLIVPVSMSMVGNLHMMGNGPGIPHVSGQLQNMQISSQMGANGGMLTDHPMMMDPLSVPMVNLDPQLQPGDGGVPHYNISSMGTPVQLQPQSLYQSDYGNSVGGGTSLTEFTKRRNWSQRLLEELQDFLHILTPEMKIVYASPSGKSLTGYDTEELLGRMITEYIHPDDATLFMREFHESASSGQPLRMFYRFRKKDNSYVILETNGHPHFSETHPHMQGSLTPKGFFMMARQYPTKNAGLLDSFLEYKIEHERLTRRIAELRKEESEDQQQQIRQRQAQLQQRQHDGSSTVSHSVTDSGETHQYSMMPGSTGTLSSHSGSMAPPAKPGPVHGQNGTLLTRQNLEMIDATNSSKVDSLRDKIARFEGATHMETIEMLTGLRYREGERSRGISTGDTSPSLIRGDVGVPIPMDKESRHTGEKKKKQKIADEYVCTDCGTLDSPEWRKGPKGPKTLCNACGLRWAKREKKRTQGSGPSQTSPLLNGHGSVSTHSMASA